MRVPIYTLAVPVLAALAFAQDTPPSQPQQPSAQPSAADKSATDTKTSKKDKGMDSGATAGQESRDRLAEMKTQTYSGTLVDAACGGSGATGATSSSTSSTSSAASAGAQSSTSADRSAASGSSQSCAVSANTTKFGLKLNKEDRTVMFDDVGNQRAQEAFKVHKKWSDSASANKPVRVKVSGVMSGDRLTVVSIN